MARVALFVGAWVLGGTVWAFAQQAPEADLASEALYNRDCAGCHPGPNLDVPTDRIWLDQILHTN